MTFVTSHPAWLFPPENSDVGKVDPDGRTIFNLSKPGPWSTHTQSRSLKAGARAVGFFSQWYHQDVRDRFLNLDYVKERVYVDHLDTRWTDATLLGITLWQVEINVTDGVDDLRSNILIVPDYGSPPYLRIPLRAMPKKEGSYVYTFHSPVKFLKSQMDNVGATKFVFNCQSDKPVNVIAMLHGYEIRR